MWLLPSALRAKVAVAALLGILFVPVMTSSLRGLTHVLTCDEASDVDFSVRVDDEGVASIQSSVFVEPGGDRTLCGGLLVDVRMTPAAADRARLSVVIENPTGHDWHGTIRLQRDRTPIPLSIGRIPAGSTRTEQVDLRLSPGRSYEIGGRLLLGP